VRFLLTFAFSTCHCSAVLDRTPYGATGYELLIGALFVPKNYIAIVQDMRGRYGSQGEWELWRKDADDGYDTINWITSQSWSDGNVMSFGISGTFFVYIWYLV
jgi:uncharacterized protein